MKAPVLFVQVFVFAITATNTRNNLDSYVTHFHGAKRDLESLLYKYGYEVEKQIIPFYFKVRKKELANTFKAAEITASKLQNEDTRVASFFQEEYFSREKRTTPKTELNVTDSLWSEQWYLDPRHIPTMGIHNAWKKGLTGNGIVIAIVDDGIDTAHTDLVDNYNASLSKNIILDNDNPSHIHSSEGHGTNCAGIAAAVRNGDCIIGVAYEATLSAIRLLDVEQKSTASDESSALVYKLDSIDIYSNSWGPIDDGAGYESSDKLGALQQAALIYGVTMGRGGKGAIYVWASGNGGNSNDDCNVDGYSNSMYTISINALRPDGAKAWYAEECTAIMAVTYGGDNGFDEIATTEPGSRCVDDFEGTSAACPMAAGIIALVLEANPELSWRDIQHLIVENSSNAEFSHANFYTNGVGKRVSLSHGFGMLNAELLVDSATSWKTVPKRILCDGSVVNATRSSEGTKTLQVIYRVDNCFIGFLEHVLLTLRFRVLWRQHTSIFLVSPSGTQSRILRERNKDKESSIVDWTFMSVHTWGENPVGEWTIKFQSSERTNIIFLYSWKLELYGTVTNPLHGIQNDGDIGGFCNVTEHCQKSNSVCLESDNICIDCSNGFHVIGSLCIRDGIESGYCDVSTVCIDEENGCNATSNQCVKCGAGFHIIDSFCVKDGTLGGFCDNVVICTEVGIGCDSKSFTCVNCSAGYHIIETFCVEDGSLGGYCDSDIECTEISTGCDVVKSICINCLLGFHVIENFCVKDGSLGGYCDKGIHCSEADVGCDSNSSICVNCTNGYRVINNFCVQDGQLGGHCDSTVLCFGEGIGCDRSSSLCINCGTGSHLIDGYCVEDGSLGGVCNLTFPCKDAHIGCDLHSNICIKCDFGFSAVGGICIKDGVLGGYCNSSIHCTEAGSGCDKNTNLCVQCSSNKHVINGFCVDDGTIGGFCNESVRCIISNADCENNLCVTEEKGLSEILPVVLGSAFGSLAGAIIIIIAVLAIRKQEWFMNRIWPGKTKNATKSEQNNCEQTSITDASDVCGK